VKVCIPVPYEDGNKMKYKNFATIKDFISIHWNHQQASPVSWDYPLNIRKYTMKFILQLITGQVKHYRYNFKTVFHKNWTFISIRRAERSLTQEI
jgi:hypothetical protein